MGVIEELHRARDSYERRDWVAAYRALSDLEGDALDAADFEALATTAFLLGRRNDAIQALQRAHQISLESGDLPAAVRAGYGLAIALWQAGEVAVGNGWFGRAARIIEEVDEDVAERGYVYDAQLMSHVFKGEFGEAFALAPQIAEYGRRFGEPDLVALGVHAEGRLMLYAGSVAEGLERMDEALAGVMAGEVGPVTSGRVYCSTIEACQEVSDLGRAGEWTRALTRWCDAQPGLLAYTGQCATHRGQLLRLHGAFADAVQELERAVERYAAFGGDPAVGQAHYELAETHRLLGDLPEAERSYEAAARHGHPGQPGRALLWLAQDRPDDAAAAVGRLLAERQGPVHRAQVLPAAVQVLVAAGDAEAAVPLAEELLEIGNRFGCTALRAAGHHAVALAALSSHEADEAVDSSRRSLEQWAQLSAPYELARARVVLGRALRLLGDEQSAVSEMEAALSELTRLGAEPDRRDVAALLGTEGQPGGLTDREIEVLRLVATGMSNTQIADTLTLSEKTVARHLSNIFTKLGVASRTAAAAFAFEHHLT
jgi:DNA-binding NarL/FixJ family response regulator